MSVRTNILNMSKIYDRTISQSAIMFFMNHQGPLEAPSMVACFHHKIPTGFMMLLDYKKIKKIKPSACTVQPTSADDDKTPCFFCEISYCESSVEWFLCKNCGAWVCGTCAGRAVTGKKTSRQKTFLCDSCKST